VKPNHWLKKKPNFLNIGILERVRAKFPVDPVTGIAIANPAAAVVPPIDQNEVDSHLNKESEKPIFDAQIKCQSCLHNSTT